MEDSTQEPNRHNQEVMDMGATALMNSGSEQPDDDATPPTGSPAPKSFKKIGSLVLSNSDEKLLEPGEVLVSVVHRHPIGLIAIYLEMFTGIAGIITLALLAMFVFFNQTSAGTRGLIVLGAVFMILFLMGLLAIAARVYRQCRLIITDVSLVQVMQYALFNRKISRLSMSNVEDVNSEQHGILSSIFDYGTVTVQTAGQEDNFVFPYCPDPDNLTDRILEARQQYVRKYGERRPVED